MPTAIKKHKTGELKKLKNHNPKLVDQKKPYSIFKKILKSKVKLPVKGIMYDIIISYASCSINIYDWGTSGGILIHKHWNR